jgi:peptidylprolyl isomerase domain and WD repeat-containing protein 1
MQVSVDGLLCCTISNDRSVKIYDVVNYDMMFMMRLPYVPGAIEWVYREGDVKPKLAVSDGNTPFVHIYDTHSGSIDPIISKEVSASAHIFLYNCCESSIGCLLYGLLVNCCRFTAVL